jgi:hypothetical protein
MDHLICFLPGALALDVLHRDRPGAAGDGRKQKKPVLESLPKDGSPGNVSMLPKEKVSELSLAHKLMQSCVHMYFRTASDLAPEITRFNGIGYVDDLGSMHNILRPETIESLMVMWRTTKAQIYRNWGQRLLAAFSRTRTPYGFASLHNVNEPWRQRDDMPSFFVAETVKYLYLLFSPDSALSLTDMVLSTEAHPLPLLAKANGTRWPCRSPSASLAENTRQSVPTAPTKPGLKRVQHLHRATARAKAKALGKPPPPKIQKLQEDVDSLPPAPDPPTANFDPSDEYSPPPPPLTDDMPDDMPELADDMPKPHGNGQSADDMPQPPGNEACWQGGFSYELCCWPPKVGNTACWDGAFTYETCCRAVPSRG